jgi:creatinine amidohydrolase
MAQKMTVPAKHKSLLFEDHTREELRALSEAALVVVPLGATEQHGPHLPVGTDYLTVEHLAVEAARRVSSHVPVLVAPALPYGCSEHHLPFGGTLSLGSKLYYDVLCGLIRSLARSGFRRMFLLNGHGGNHELMQIAARDMALEHEIQVGAASYWLLARDSLLAHGAHKGANLPGHAGRFETSLMLALRGEMVSPQRPARAEPADGAVQDDPLRTEKSGFWQSIDGYTDSPVSATAALGKEYLPLLIEDVAEAFYRFYRSTLDG